MSRLSRMEWAMGMALITSKRSTCCRRQVGCVLLNSRGHVLSTGYNGVAAGQPHCNDLRPGIDWCQEAENRDIYPNACPGAFSPSGTNLDGCYAIHAEQNAMLQCKDVWEIETCVVTASPCITCCKLLLNTSCRVVVFKDNYPHNDARDLWIGSGRQWVSYSNYISE